MTITRTAKGTAASNGAFGGTTVTLSSVAMTTGDTIVVCTAMANGAEFSTVKWNGTDLTKIVAGIWYLANVTGATGNVVANRSVGNFIGGAITALSLSGVTSSPLDQSATATGTSTSPSSGATATTAQANEILIGSIGHNSGTPTNPQPGSWSNSFTAGQFSENAGTTTCVEDGYLLVSATGAYTAAKTGDDNLAWVASIATFKDTTAGGGVVPSSYGYRFIAGMGA